MLTTAQNDVRTDADEWGQLRMCEEFCGYTASLIDSFSSAFLFNLHHLVVDVLEGTLAVVQQCVGSHVG